MFIYFFATIIATVTNPSPPSPSQPKRRDPSLSAIFSRRVLTAITCKWQSSEEHVQVASRDKQNYSTTAAHDIIYYNIIYTRLTLLVYIYTWIDHTIRRRNFFQTIVLYNYYCVVRFPSIVNRKSYIYIYVQLISWRLAHAGPSLDIIILPGVW